VPQTIEQVLETTVDSAAYSVQFFSVLLYLMTLGCREPDILNKDSLEEIAKMVELWFNSLLENCSAVNGKFSSKQTLMLFFSCFAFGPLILIAPDSMQVLSKEYQNMVNKLEELVTQQDSRSFDNIMILIFSMLKSIDPIAFIEKTGVFVSRKKVSAFEADSRAHPDMQEVHPRLLHDERS
jgi:hypothetical protein